VVSSVCVSVVKSFCLSKTKAIPETVSNFEFETVGEKEGRERKRERNLIIFQISQSVDRYSNTKWM